MRIVVLPVLKSILADIHFIHIWHILCMLADNLKVNNFLDEKWN